MTDNYLHLVILFSPTITPRLRYIADFIGRELSGKPFQLTTDRQEFENSSDAKINYSNEAITANELRISPNSLLFETGTRHHEIETFNKEDDICFFSSDDDFGFDVFAASFYLISRYEEYLPHKKDQYGRYAHENSLAYREDFLDKPLVNTWIKKLREKLVSRFPGRQFYKPQFR